MTKERDQLNATLLQLSNEVTRLQGLSRWSMFRGSCYLLSATTGSWYEGRADCRKRGGDLVVIDDDDEQKFVATLTGWSAWIGLTDQDTEGSWKWVDGTSLSSE
ncbi:PREDICTED: CD209 antigen-like protein E [Poecilia mexicana]|uniref:CD209 antigen-like protein E n=1 Tax=Poecilia mexicana TaxID=48701 RepID=UPI00072DE405|nr:PREDICTED: CD209 antigen-like protein E [Poecilia mexicana]